MPKVSSQKHERDSPALDKRFEREHRHPGRADEVAAKIVEKQRRPFGETRDGPQARHLGFALDRNLPIARYGTLTAAQIARRLDGLSVEDVERIREYERHHAGRKTLLAQIDRWMARR